MNIKKGRILFIVMMAYTLNAFTQVDVSVNYEIQKYIGNISELNRDKYILLHDWADADSDITEFKNEYKLGSGGRGFWGPFSYAKNQTGVVGTYPSPKNSNNTNIRAVKREVATEHPGNVYKQGLDKEKAADWVVEYYKNFVSDGNVPEYFETMNEPFVHAGDFGSDQENIRREMAQLYAAIGKKIHETPELSNMKVVGYASAWPSMELWDFEHWESRMKMFMDIAGEHMDAFSTHLYDGVNITGQKNYRSGSNAEAILDLIETYSYFKWGHVKPHAITEYGTIVETQAGSNWSSVASGKGNVGQNHLLMGLLDREDRLEISIPFTTGKSTWHINQANNCQPYGPCIMVPENLGNCNPLGWEYTPRLYFYSLLKDIKGKRVLIKSDNPDIQTQAFVEGNKLSILLCNIDHVSHEVNINYASTLEDLVSVTIKSLKTFDDTGAEYQETVNYEVLSNLILLPAEIVSIEYVFNNVVDFKNKIQSQKYYNTNHLVPISGTQSFEFNNIELGDDGGFATLRLSVGRNTGLPVLPEQILLNNENIDIPQNWEGYNQANREDFFGTIEIPLPYEKLKPDNIFQINYNNAGGKISSVILDIELFKDNIVGLDDLNYNQIKKPKIYPTIIENDALFIDLASDHKFDKIEFYSVYGTIVKLININSSDTNIRIKTSAILNGMYLVKLSGFNEMYQGRIIIQ